MSDERITLTISIPKALSDLLIDAALIQVEESDIVDLTGLEPTGALTRRVEDDLGTEDLRGNQALAYSLSVTELVRDAAFEHVVKAYLDHIKPQPPCTHTDDDGLSTINAFDICDACGLDLETGKYDGEE